jgi:hypothetical protein
VLQHTGLKAAAAAAAAAITQAGNHSCIKPWQVTFFWHAVSEGRQRSMVQLLANNGHPSILAVKSSVKQLALQCFSTQCCKMAAKHSLPAFHAWQQCTRLQQKRRSKQTPTTNLTDMLRGFQGLLAAAEQQQQHSVTLFIELKEYVVWPRLVLSKSGSITLSTVSVHQRILLSIF